MAHYDAVWGGRQPPHLTGGGETTLDSKAAILLACITMIAADGDVDDDELAILRRIDGPRATPAWDNALKAWKKHNFDECIALVAKFVDRSRVNPLMANLIDIARARASGGQGATAARSVYGGALARSGSRRDVHRSDWRQELRFDALAPGIAGRWSKF